MHIDASSALAVDIGNTAIHVGIVDTKRHRCLRRSNLPLSGIRDRLPGVLDTLVSAKMGKNASLMLAVISGGNSGVAAEVRALLKNPGIEDVVDLAWHAGLPVRFRYQNARLLGPDRIADALYAAAAYPKRNAIIIDAGTAVTVDALRGDGEFIGGVIFPGPATQLQSLHETTSALPLINLSKKAVPLPGGSTEECMRSGVVHGIAGGLDLLVKKYRSSLGGRCVVLATGGGWNAVKKYVGFKYSEEPDMTLIGAALYLDSKSSAFQT